MVARSRKKGAPRKDRLVQTRVPRRLEATLKAEASRRRLSVSQLVRNVLEDAFDLVDDVASDVERIVSDSLTLARNARRNTRRLARGGRREEPDGLAGIYAWNQVIAREHGVCAHCGAAIDPGAWAFVGLRDASGPRAWLCTPCAPARATRSSER